MLFNSLEFLYVFLPITYLVFWRLTTKNQRYVWLTITGYVFYGFWDYRFCALLAFSTLVSYFAGLGLLRSDTRHRKLFLTVPIVSDLLVLAFFKYADFGINTANSVSGWLNWETGLTPLNIILPIGISFYTFHNISYIVDAYRGVIRPTRNFWEYTCYVSLFSQLVAGPIVRFRQIEADLDTIDRKDRTEFLNMGWSFFAIGMIEKVLIADSIATIINPALEQYGSLSSVDAWLVMLGYSYQLYFDFRGYSHMAVGLGYMFGLHIPQNFNSPYKALNIQDFWRRWHISLFACLRDYVYIPLGGNRVPVWKIYRNLLLTMLLGGLWHGAAWTFVCWGLYHGTLLALYRAYGRYWDWMHPRLQHVGTFLLAVVGWVLFRAETFQMAWVLLTKMFWFSPGPVVVTGATTLVVLLLVAGALAHFGPNGFDLTHDWSASSAIVMAVLFLLCVLSIYGAKPAPFLYFQF